MAAANGTVTAAMLGREEKVADQPSRSRLLGPAVRRVNGEAKKSL